ncbi:MAG TPA: hypothetical protein VLG38_05560 [Gammaproteobacteria bacterium]|nr:hypothetical protein [Gammaproteobacteria bacterium]
MAGLIKFIINVLIVVILAAAVYIVGLMFQIVPMSFTPQELLKPQYATLKDSLSKDIAAKDATSGLSQSLLNFLNGVEAGYKKPDMASKVMPGTPADAGTMPGVATSTGLPATTPPEQIAPTTLPATTGTATTTTAPTTNAPTTLPGTTAPTTTTSVPGKIAPTAVPVPGNPAPPMPTPDNPAPMVPAPTTTTMPTTMPSTTAPAPTTAPTQPAATDPVTKTQQTIQQYQQSVDQEKKALDSI